MGRHPLASIAVIGAGIAGLTVAAELATVGHRVSLFDKSHGPGGRCATRRSVVGAFDHGAPGFGATTAAFHAQAAAWRKAGWVSGDGTSAAMAASNAAWRLSPSPIYGVPSMNALALQLAAELPATVALCTDSHVTAIEPSAADAGWQLRLSHGTAHPSRFDAVVVAVPAEQAAMLLAPDAMLAEAMRGIRSDPCWTLMAAWARPLPAVLEASGLSSDPRGVLSLVRREEASAGRTIVDDIASRWVLHATPQWTLQHLEAQAETVIAKLLDAFEGIAGANLQAPVHAVAHRWRYAQVPSPCTEPFGWNEALRLGACGDAWHARGDPGSAAPGGIERAWLSGRSLAQQMCRALSPD
ncbi:MAG: NAD(P)-binding protein [Burkholderiales bacterium]